MGDGTCPTERCSEALAPTWQRFHVAPSGSHYQINHRSGRPLNHLTDRCGRRPTEGHGAKRTGETRDASIQPSHLFRVRSRPCGGRWIRTPR